MASSLLPAQVGRAAGRDGQETGFTFRRLRCSFLIADAKGVGQVRRRAGAYRLGQGRSPTCRHPRRQSRGRPPCPSAEPPARLARSRRNRVLGWNCRSSRQCSLGRRSARGRASRRSFAPRAVNCGKRGARGTAIIAACRRRLAPIMSVSQVSCRIGFPDAKESTSSDRARGSKIQRRVRS